MRMANAEEVWPQLTAVRLHAGADCELAIT